MNDIEKGYKELYTAANELMAKVGCEGEIEINTMDDLVVNIMDALFVIDGGAFDNDRYGFIEVETKYIVRGNGIHASHWHDAGAYGRCSYCLRYSDDPNCLELDFECNCGRKNGYSGSFKKPENESLWNE